MTARIPTRSRRQAMDWSLALMSQGIESTLDYSEEQGWGLIVAAAQQAEALQVIAQYRAENLHWPWQQPISQPHILFDWGSLAWVFLLGAFFWLSTENPALRSAGLMNSELVSHGHWWRLFTAMFLHGDAGHLATNASIGLVLLGLTMGRYGTGIGLLAGLLAGAGGNVATWLVYESHRSLGASGMVMGCVGLLAAQSLPFPQRNPRAWKYALTGLVGGMMLFVLMGLTPGTDVLAHFGGFVTGGLLGFALLFIPRLPEKSAANILAGMLFCTLVILTWWLALQGGTAN